MKYDIQRMANVYYNASRLLHRKPSFRVVFHHLPKCGGTSIHQAIRRCFPLDPRIETRIVADASARTAALTGQPLFTVREELLLYHMALARMAYISGHVPFSERAALRFGDQWSFVAIIRHPVARWFSSYFYSRALPPGTHGRIEVGLEEHLESPAGRESGSAYLRFFAGTIDEEPTIERALEMIRRFAVVGVLEDLNAFTEAFHTRFRKRLKVPHFNRNPVAVSVQRQKVTPDLWRRVEEMCEPDLEFYEAVRGAPATSSKRTHAQQGVL